MVARRDAQASASGALRSTGAIDAIKMGEDLAAPITFTPFKNTDHVNRDANPEALRNTETGHKMKSDGNLARPITHIKDALKQEKKAKRSSLKARPQIVGY